MTAPFVAVKRDRFRQKVRGQDTPLGKSERRKRRKVPKPQEEEDQKGRVGVRWKEQKTAAIIIRDDEYHRACLQNDTQK